MLLLIVIIVFVVVSLGIFALGSALDQRNARARLLRDRLASVQKAAEREPSEELALLRDEILSEIPALDNLLRRSARVSNLQLLLAQAGLDMRAGNMLMLCVDLRAGPGGDRLLRRPVCSSLAGWASSSVPSCPTLMSSYRRTRSVSEI